jgi:type IV secretory pathway VirJ component
MNRELLAALLALATASPSLAAPAPEPFRFARHGTVTLYRPAGPVSGVVILFSGDRGWNQRVVGVARQLTAQGAAVAGVSTPAYLRAWETGKATCVNPNVDTVALAQEVEHRLGLKSYSEPILAGYSSGGAIAYATLAQAPAGLYRGAISLGFGPDVPGVKPWCRANDLTATRITKPVRGWLFAPVAKVSAPWIVLQGLKGRVVSPDATRAFVRRIAGAHLIEQPRAGHGFSKPSNWAPQLRAAFRALVKRPMASQPRRDATGAALPNDVPITLVVSQTAHPTELMAVFYSGDGGWAGLDRSVSARLAAAGIPVLGVNSLQYYWNARTPAQSARDLTRIITSYGVAWHRPRVVLIGYSFGAGALPSTVAALPPAIRTRIAQLTLMGLPARGELEFHLADWLNASRAPAVATAPLVARLGKVLRVQCLRGAQESDSACAAIPPGRAQQVVLPGGHHFAGNDAAVTRAILSGLKPA